MGIFKDQSEFATYRAVLQFRGKIVGGVPRNPKVIEGWIKKKMGVTDEPELRSMVIRTLQEMGLAADESMTEAQLMELYSQVASDAAFQQANGFKRDALGPYIESRQVKAMIKESTAILFGKERWGPTYKGAKGYTAERVFPAQNDMIPLMRTKDGDLLDERFPETDLSMELVIGHIDGPKGPQSTLTYVEMAERPWIEIELMVLRDLITMDTWAAVWNFAEENGLGAMRSQGYGRFDVMSFDLVDAPKQAPVKARTIDSKKPKAAADDE